MKENIKDKKTNKTDEKAEVKKIKEKDKEKDKEEDKKKEKNTIKKEKKTLTKKINLKENDEKNINELIKEKEIIIQRPKFNIIEIILVAIMTLIIGIIVGRIFFGNIGVNSYTKEMNKVYETLMKEYDGKVDPHELSDAAIKGMMNCLEDDYSFYFSEEEKNNFLEELDGSFIGLGVEITKEEGDSPTIVNVLKNTVAEKAGLQPNDKFLKVDGVDVTEESPTELAARIKGTKSKTIKLLILRNDEEIEKTITTNKVEITSIASEIYERNNKKIGYIYISVFAKNTDEQFEEELKDLESKGIDSLIIDVRDNLGGHLDTVTNILNLFLNKSQVLYQLKKDDNITKVYGKSDDTRKYNVVVLTNGASASASEVLTSALAEEYKAETIGTKTYGKGTVQTTMVLSSGSMVKYTTEEWLTSTGENINKIGIEPNIHVDLNEEYFNDYSIDKDNQLQTAINTLANK